MTGQLLGNEPVLRLAAFASVFATMALWELAAPWRERAIPLRLRWSGNLGLLAIDTLLVRLLFPVLAVGLAILAGERGWGLLNLVDLPGWAAFAIGLVALDLAIYLQHRLFHFVPWLWRLHRMHHADLELDVSTGLRFHPGEILLSMAIKLGVVAALGPPAAAVLVFEILLNATSMFNHANVRMPPVADRLLRWLVVTPDMHRIHHSVRRDETDSNFGFNLSWWDRLLGTYRARPADGPEAMTIGLERFRSRRDLRLDRLLIQPFLPERSGLQAGPTGAAAE